MQELVQPYVHVNTLVCYGYSNIDYFDPPRYAQPCTPTGYAIATPHYVCYVFHPFNKDLATVARLSINKHPQLIADIIIMPPNRYFGMNKIFHINADGSYGSPIIGALSQFT